MSNEIGPHPTRRTARAPSSRRAVRHFPSITLALAALTAASCGSSGPPPEKGLYVYCDGVADGLHYVNGLNYEKIHHFSLPCLGPEFVNETGETGHGEINLGEWTNDAEDIELLRTMCVAECKHQGSGAGECEQVNGKVWQIRNYNDLFVPDPLMYIKDPWRRICDLPAAKLAPLPWETQVIPQETAPVWPNTEVPIELGCGSFENCAKEFASPIAMFLFYDDTATPWGADMGHADYLASTSPGNSMLELTVVNRGSAPSTSLNEIGGRIEYSAADCDEDACPFYLANLALVNATDTWELYSDALDRYAYITNIEMQLRRPTLGAWNTSSNEFYIGTERIEVYLSARVQIGDEPPVEMAFLLTNEEAIFGEIGEEGTINILDFIVDDGGNLALEIDLEFDAMLSESLSTTDLSP